MTKRPIFLSSSKQTIKQMPTKLSWSITMFSASNVDEDLYVECCLYMEAHQPELRHRKWCEFIQFPSM